MSKFLISILYKTVLNYVLRLRFRIWFRSLRFSIVRGIQVRLLGMTSVFLFLSPIGVWRVVVVTMNLLLLRYGPTELPFFLWMWTVLQALGRFSWFFECGRFCSKSLFPLPVWWCLSFHKSFVLWHLGRTLLTTFCCRSVNSLLNFIWVLTFVMIFTIVTRHLS